MLQVYQGRVVSSEFFNLSQPMHKNCIVLAITATYQLARHLQQANFLSGLTIVSEATPMQVMCSR